MADNTPSSTPPRKGTPMDKTKVLDHLAADADSRMSLARLLDQLELCRRRDIPTHSHFLSDGEQALAVQAIAAAGEIRWTLEGGFAAASRKVCRFLPDWMETPDEPPLAAVEVKLPREGEGAKKLSHRDFLGSLMGLGITRDLLGDILVGEDTGQVVCLASALPILLEQWREVGRYSASPKEIPLSRLTPAEEMVQRRTETFQSLRFDAVAASAFRIPRSKAAALISGGRLLLNHLPCTKPDRLLQEGDSLNGKGLGKCKLTKVNGLSRKGRILVEMERYV
mgnify:FL=1